MLMVEMELEDVVIVAKRNDDGFWEVKYGTDTVINFDFVTMTDNQFAAMMFLSIGGDDTKQEMYDMLHDMVRNCESEYRPIP